MQYFTPAQNLDFLLRLLVACACGAAIGYERSRRFKEAGIRTHVIICCAAALIMIVSKYGFVDLGTSTSGFFPGTRGADPARIAAAVVSGIGFLGAGAIFRNKNAIKGLTTAAGLWATAGIGLAVGAGMYWLGVAASAIICSLQYLMHHFTVGSDAFQNSVLEFDVDSEVDFQPLLSDFVESLDGQISSYSYAVSGSTTHYSVTLKSKKPITMELMNGFSKQHSGIRGASASKM
ncbi:MAG: MgtC/SapB family protein [Firmicutes bacterium]|nr:MgtC/SapB family protein [Bacillota bacterium]MBQ4410261.1 MgtC/SapB family protein [Bacillota bacterium]